MGWTIHSFNTPLNSHLNLQLLADMAKFIQKLNGARARISFKGYVDFI